MRENSIIEFKPIGVIRSPFKEPEGTPIQPVGAVNSKGRVELSEEYEEGLKGLEGFSHIILLYFFHAIEGYSLKVVPFLDEVEQGVFATRAPKRPNAIGLSIVKLDRIEKNILYVENIDILDGTPLLDIKPYASVFDNVEFERNGWLSKSLHYAYSKRADNRFN